MGLQCATLRVSVSLVLPLPAMEEGLQNGLAALPHNTAPGTSDPALSPDLLVALVARWCDAPLAVLALSSPLSPHLECFQALTGWPLAGAEDICVHTADALSATSLHEPLWLCIPAPPQGAPQNLPLVVADTLQHPQLCQHHWVQSAPRIRALAAVALLDSSGARLGTLAVLDTRARRFSDEQMQALSMLAGQAALQLQAQPDEAVPEPEPGQTLEMPPAAKPRPAVPNGAENGLAHGHGFDTDADADAAEEAQAHTELLQVQRCIFTLDLKLPQVLELVAGAALRISGVGSAGGAMVELLEDGQLVVRASAGPMGRAPGRAMALQDSLLWPSVGQGSKLLCNDTQAAGWRHFTGPGGETLRSALALPLRSQSGVAGLLKVVSVQANAFGARCVAHLEVLAETLGSMVQLRHLTEQLDASHQQYKLLFDTHPQPMWLHALEGRQRILAANHAMVALYGHSEAALLQMDAHQLLAAPCPAGAAPGAAGAAHPPWQALAAPDGSARQRYCLQDGRVLEAETFARTLHFNGIAACQVVLTEVTGQLRTEREHARVGRAQQLLALCNETLVRTCSETELLHSVCRLAVDTGGWRSAWVGLVRGGAGQRMEPVAHAGLLPEQLERLGTLGLCWSGLHPEGAALSVSEAASAPECSGLPALHGAEGSSAEGSGAVVSLALQHQDQTFGLLRLHAEDAVLPGVQETALLQKLANDLAFGINALRIQKEQHSLQASVLKVAAAVSASTGTAFFEQLARNMAEALGAQVACIGRLAGPKQPGAQAPKSTDAEIMAESLAIVVDGELQPNGWHNLARTPTSELLQQQQYLVAENVQQAYPDAPIVRAISAQAYAGMQLQGSQGQPLGMLFVLFRQPLERPQFVLSTLQIFAARCAAELERQLADARIRRQASLLDSAQDAILVRDLEHRVLFWNKGAERAYGWTQEEALGQRITDLIYNDAAAFDKATAAVLAQGVWSGEMPQRHRAGHSLDMEGRWTLVCDAEGQPESILVINTDITARKATERQIQRLAFYDPLTGLPNRMLLMDRMEHALASARCNRQGGALLFIDLDNFKTLNDTLGHDKGDLLLQLVARRLEASVRGTDTVARLGGDEFVLLLEGLSGEHDVLVRNARDMGEAILACLSAPYDLDGYQYRSTPSIGIAPFSGTAGAGSAGSTDTVGELLQQADLAMYQAKTAGRHTLRFFDPHMQQVVTERAALEADLRAALAEDQFSLHYQPQVNHLGEYIGVEALLRWTHPERGNVPPTEFIPLAEETGLILMLGRWVLHTACRRLAQWRKHPQLRHLTMAVNVSSRQFRHACFVQDVVRVLAVTGAPSSLLKLELTESLLVEDMDTTIATMRALRTYSIGFALDDFGTGYSSLSYLKRMPLDQLKIDQGFVRDLLSDPNDAAIVNTIIGLSQSLGLQVLAEGVETTAQRDMLLRAGCENFQGYLYGRPMPETDIDAVLLAPVPE